MPSENKTPAVSSEAVEAACRALINPLSEPSDTERRRMHTALTAAVPHMTGAVQVKPLEWRIFCSNSGNSEAKSPMGEYIIQSETDGWVMYLPHEQDDGTSFPTIEAAKAAAQADFEKRIRSALVATPPAPSSADSGMLAVKANSDLKRRLQEALRFAASRSVMSSADEQAILSVFDAAEAATPAEGWVLVPVEPTPEILDAVAEECKAAWGTRSAVKAVPSRSRAEWREIAKPFYRAMLSAAPKGGR